MSEDVVCACTGCLRLLAIKREVPSKEPVPLRQTASEIQHVSRLVSDRETRVLPTIRFYVECTYTGSNGRNDQALPHQSKPSEIPSPHYSR